MTPYTNIPFKTKKEFKTYLNQEIGPIIDPTPFETKTYTNYSGPIVGPSPQNRKWYATITVKDGILTKVV